MFLSREEAVSSRADAMKTMSAHTQKAFDQLWALQSAEGPSKGAMAVVRGQSRSLGERRVRPLRRVAGGDCAHADARGVSRDTPRCVNTQPSLNAYLMDSIDSRRLHDRLALLLAGSNYP